jgi:sirohydrochlorin cobaltochelatase
MDSAASPSITGIEIQVNQRPAAMHHPANIFPGGLPLVGTAPAARETASQWRRPGLGLLVVGHGTADPIGAEETRQVARRAAAMLPGVPVELGFLEVIGPSLGESLLKLAARGARDVVAAPLLLFAAGHAKQDVPEALAEGARNAGVTVQQSNPFGCHPDIVALSRQRRCEAIRGLEPLPAGATVLLMVGRGSSDPSAHRQLHDFTAATLDTEPDGCRHGAAGCRVELGFVAAARPTLAEAIEAAATGAGPVRRVIVQPHLLFRGHVEDQVAAAILQARSRHPGIEWVQAGRLGPDDRVARALVELSAATPSVGAVWQEGVFRK